MYAGTTTGVFRGVDSRRSFDPEGLRWSNRTSTLMFDARTDPPTLYYGGEGGVVKTNTGGLWWDVGAAEAVDALSRFGLPCQRKGPQCLLVVRSWSVPQPPLLRS